MDPRNLSSFLLNTSLSEKLFHDVAAPLPIIDYHNHLDPVQLAGNFRFENIASLWVTSDPYKNRAMRICGIPEEEITGNAPDKQKFINWCRTIPSAIGSPLYHWSIMELNTFFGIDIIPDEKNAELIWQKCNKQLEEKNMGIMDLLKLLKVEILCTSDDFCDDVTVHPKASSTGHGIRVFPSLRADSALNFNPSLFPDWLKRLEHRSSVRIKDLGSYCGALTLRMEEFARAGCLASDHSLDSGFKFIRVKKDHAALIFREVLQGEAIDSSKDIALRSWILQFLAEEYGRRNWIMQLHIGARRATSSRLKRLAGLYGGFATIGNACDIESLCIFLDSLELKANLPDTILYTLNPSDNQAFATLTGSFAEDGVAGKIQFGPAWWYNDHYEGIKQHLTTLASYSLISRFIGMTTDSRSVLSFSRHEYFRRILCGLLGEWVDKGIIPGDEKALSKLVSDISYNNIKQKIHTRIQK